MRLYDYVLSGNCYKIRLLLSFLGLDYEKRPVDFYPGAEHKSPEFLGINPLGQLPVLDDEGQVLRDAQAILVHIATKYGMGTNWYPVERAGAVQQWLAFADGITGTASAARLHDLLGYDLEIDKARADAHRLFRVLEDHVCHQEFKGSGWLVGETATIADIACFPYTAMAGDGGIDPSIYPGIQRWIRRFSEINGYHNMPGINIIR